SSYMQHTTLVTVRVKPDIAERLEKLAELMDRSKSYLAAEAIEEYLDVQEWRVKAIKEGIAEADRGELIDSEEVKKQWRKRLEDKND
ncbi:MAG: CopG family ribbon-helix-helix protein, partial [Gammaproteobacteria bacterium]|nr:CopG family ribbon-helix-helix protein [Gammaproteobacteria bacterium]